MPGRGVAYACLIQPHWKMTAKKRVTAAQLAQECGVSPSTVSLILNGRGARFNEATREAVLSKAEEMGLLASGRFKRGPGVRSRSLKNGLLIGFLYPEREGEDHGFHTPYIFQVFQGLEASTRGTEYLLVPIPVGQLLCENVPKGAELLSRHQLDGAIVMGECASEKLLTYLKENGVSVGVLDNAVHGRGCRCVRIDNLNGTCQAALHLMQHYPSVGMVMPADNQSRRSDILERTNGVLLAYATAGRVWNPEQLWTWDFEKSGEENSVVMLSWLKRLKKPAGIVCFDDAIAVGLLNACRAAGLRVPEDIGIVGFNDIPTLTEIVTPKLSSVRVPWKQLGAEAFRQISSAIVDPQESAASSILPVELVVRDSSVPKASKRKGR